MGKSGRLEAMIAYARVTRSHSIYNHESRIE